MHPNEYQELALRTATPNQDARTRLNVAALGLAGEAGEFVDQIKKHLFHGHELNREHLAAELGDVLWYVAIGCEALGVQLDDVMEGNIAKLRRRYPEGFSAERSQNRE